LLALPIVVTAMTYAVAAAAEPFAQDDVFVGGRDGYKSYRIPALLTTRKGTLLAFCEGRKYTGKDADEIDLVLKRSFDLGETWQPLKTVWADGNTCGNPCVVEDRDTGTVWLLLSHNLAGDLQADIEAGRGRGTRTVWVTRSDDDGATWATPTEITAAVKRPNWTWYGTGEGIGIQTASGRLVIPGEARELGTLKSYALVIYSDDHGRTWRPGGIVGDAFGESQVVELSDGSLLLNMRNHNPTGTTDVPRARGVAVSRDGGLTWSAARHDATLVEPFCQASILRLSSSEPGKCRIAFSNPAGATAREKLTVRLSDDDGRTWPVARIVNERRSGYSCLAELSDGRLACLYETREAGSGDRLRLARFTLAWLKQPH
jgi:sialidase-1